MIIGSVSSQTIKILFNTINENLFLGDIIKVVNKDNVGILAQVTKIDSSKDKPSCNIASCKILFTLSPDNKLVNWKGNVPSKDNTASILSNKEIGIYTGQNNSDNISIGQLTLYQNSRFSFNADSLKNPALIFCDKQEQRTNFSLLLSEEIAKNNKKAVLLDFRGEYSDVTNAARLVAGVDFKLPLDSKGIDILYERTLVNTSAETKATIEDIFMSVQEYADECEQKFIPFSSFKQVVEDEYNQNNIPELVLLKNKLIKLDKEGIFANEEEEVNALNLFMAENNFIILDLSKIPSLWHREFIDFILSINIERYNQEFFLILEVIDKNFNDELLNKLYVHGTRSKLYPVAFVGYGSRYADDIMTVTQNLIFFSPKIQTDKFPEYDVFINRLDSSEALIIGQITNEIPLFVRIDQIALNKEMQEEIEKILEPEPVKIAPPQYSKEETSNEQPVVESQPVYTDSEEEIYEQYEGQNLQDLDEQEFSNDSNDSEEELMQTQFDDVDELYTNRKTEEDIQETFEGDANIMPTPDIPVYSAAETTEEKAFDLKEGDNVKHQKYGEGIIKKIIGYGNKKLCSIEFTNVGRRLLDPSLAVIEKI